MRQFRQIRFVQVEKISNNYSLVEEYSSTITLKSRNNIVQHPLKFKFVKNKKLNFVKNECFDCICCIIIKSQKIKLSYFTFCNIILMFLHMSMINKKLHANFNYIRLPFLYLEFRIQKVGLKIRSQDSYYFVIYRFKVQNTVILLVKRNGCDQWKIYYVQQYSKFRIFLNMRKQNVLALEVVVLCLMLTVCCSLDTSAMTLGSNLITNSNFTSPSVPKDKYNSSYTGVKSWKLLNKCELIDIQLICKDYSQFCQTSNLQAINMTASATVKRQINQSITLMTSALYLLTVSCLASANFPYQNLSVYANSTLIESFTIQGRTGTDIQTYNSFANLSMGKTEIWLEMSGYSGSNGTEEPFMGIFLQQVYLQLIMSINTTAIANDSILNSYNLTNYLSTPTNDSNITYQQIDNSIALNSQTKEYQVALTALDLLLNNYFASALNQIPASRISAYFLMRFYKNFDRLEFYYYQAQNLTVYSQMFLSSIFEMQQMKGTLLQAVVQSYSNQSVIFESINNGLLILTNATDFKFRYQDSKILIKNINGDGFIANNINYFYYQLLVILFLHFTCWVFFKIFFKYPISSPFRKYCFTGIYCVMMFEGNIEEFVFSYLSQCRYLFSADFTHKIVNSHIVYFGFLMVFYAFGCLLWFHSYYKKMGKYFVEDYREGLLSFVSQSFESGIIPILSATIHNFFLGSMWQVSLGLILMELGSILIRSKFLAHRIYLYSFRTYLNITASIFRILLALSLLIYEETNSNSINTFHFYFILFYMSIWAAQIIYTLGCIIKQLVGFIKGKIFPNKAQKIVKTGRRSRTLDFQHLASLTIATPKSHKVRFKVVYEDVHPLCNMIEPNPILRFDESKHFETISDSRPIIDQLRNYHPKQNKFNKVRFQIKQM